MLSQASTHISVHEHQDLLKSLAQNDQLREELMQNPQETLARFGVRLPEATSQVTLPAKEAIAYHLGDAEPGSGAPPWVGVHV